MVIPSGGWREWSRTVDGARNTAAARLFRTESGAPEVPTLKAGRQAVAADDAQQTGGWVADFHQSGTTRMSASAADRVVDKDMAVHSVQNVYVASSSTFVTSEQSNFTFMIVDHPALKKGRNSGVRCPLDLRRPLTPARLT
jgi:choline dehydrogenase-like flavoprotein